MGYFNIERKKVRGLVVDRYSVDKAEKVVGIATGFGLQVPPEERHQEALERANSASDESNAISILTDGLREDYCSSFPARLAMELRCNVDVAYQVGNSNPRTQLQGHYDEDTEKLQVKALADRKPQILIGHSIGTHGLLRYVASEEYQQEDIVVIAPPKDLRSALGSDLLYNMNVRLNNLAQKSRLLGSTSLPLNWVNVPRRMHGPLSVDDKIDRINPWIRLNAFGEEGKGLGNYMIRMDALSLVENIKEREHNDKVAIVITSKDRSCPSTGQEEIKEKGEFREHRFNCGHGDVFRGENANKLVQLIKSYYDRK